MFQFLALFNKIQQIAPHVTCLKRLSDSRQLKGVVLPKVERIGFHLTRESNVAEMLTPLLFPNLKKLDIHLSDGSPGSLDHIWSGFSNLEKLSLRRRHSKKFPNDDVIFIGTGGGNREKSAFLQLTSKSAVS